MDWSAQRMQSVFLSNPRPDLEKKKAVKKTDALTRHDEHGPRYHSALPTVDQADASASGKTGSRRSTITGREIKAPVRLQDEQANEKRAPAQPNSVAVQAEYTEDTPTGNEDDYDNTSRIGRTKHPRSRPCKFLAQKTQESLEDLRGEVEKFKKHYEEEVVKNKELRRERAAKNKDIRNRGRVKRKLQMTIEDFKEKLQDERRSVAELQKTLEEKEHYIKNIEEEVFSRRKRRASDALDDHHLNDKLEEVRMLCQNFVSENAAASMVGIPKAHIVQLLGYAMPAPLPALERERLFELFIKEQGAPRMLLGILVSYSLCEKILQDPFGFLIAAGKGEWAGLQRVMEHGMMRNEELTHTWRQMTTRVLNLDGGPAALSADGDGDSVQPLARIRELFYEQLAQKFRGDACFLLKTLDENESLVLFEELMHLIRTVGEVSAMLWAQKSSTTTSKLDLGKEFILNNSPQRCKAHPCMCLDSADRRYDGRRVQLVIEPAIFAAGNEDGKNYDQWRIRLPAIGWLSEEDPDQENPNLPPHTEILDLRGVPVDMLSRKHGEVDGQQGRSAKRLKPRKLSEGLSQARSLQQDDEGQENIALLENAEDVRKLAPLSLYNDDAAVGDVISNNSSYEPMLPGLENYVAAYLSSNDNSSHSPEEKAETVHEQPLANLSPQAREDQDSLIMSSQDHHDETFLRNKPGYMQEEEEMMSMSTDEAISATRIGGEAPHQALETSEQDQIEANLDFCKVS